VTREFGEIYHRCFDAPYKVEDGEVLLAGKAGVTVFPDDGTDAEALLRNAESAVAQSKAQMESLLFYDPRMAAHVSERLVLENRLRRALEQRCRRRGVEVPKAPQDPQIATYCHASTASPSRRAGRAPCDR